MSGTTSYHSSLHPVAHDSFYPASGSFFLSPVFMDQHLQTHPQALTEELAGTSDTRGLSISPQSLEVMKCFGGHHALPYNADTQLTGTYRMSATRKAPMWSLFLSAQSE